MRKSLHIFLTSFLFLFTSGGLSAQLPPPKHIFLQRPPSHHAEILSHDSLSGRGYQDEGHIRAANYIARTFEALDLEPGNGESYLQHFTFSVNLVDSARLVIDEVPLRIGEDFIVNSFSGRGELSGEKPMDIGYGLPEDFTTKIKGKIVVFRTGLPEKIAENETLRSKYAKVSSDMQKVNYALQMGAKGVIILQPKLTAGFSTMGLDIPVVELREEKWPKKAKKIKSLDLFVDARLRRVESQNVIAVRPGTEFKDSVIIISAHYDHLGRQGSAIFNGANDNASGTGLLLSLAERYAGQRQKYSIAFVAFGAEEVGLLGSRHFVKVDPPFPMSNIRLVVNLDLMANGNEGITVVAGKENPDVVQVLEDVNQELDLFPQIKVRGNAPNSDHYWFVEEGVKAVFIYTLGGPPHYHDVHDRFENAVFCCEEALMKAFSALIDAYSNN